MERFLRNRRVTLEEEMEREALVRYKLISSLGRYCKIDNFVKVWNCKAWQKCGHMVEYFLKSL